MFTAIIPVRKGSRRLKNKNIAPFGGKNLLTYKIDQLKEVPEITSIVVSSDSDEMLEMAADRNVQVHQRAAQYCDEKTEPFGAVVAHICESIAGENVIWATCTSPLVEPQDYSDAIRIYNQKLTEGFDSLMSVEPFQRYMWTDDGPLNYELGIKHVPSQELPVYYRVTDGVLIAPREKMIRWQYFHGPNPFKYPMSKRASIDIDDPLDLACARAWLELSG